MDVGTPEKVRDNIGSGTTPGNGGYLKMTSRRDNILLGYGGDAVFGSSMQAARTEFEPPALIAAFIISNAPAPPKYFTVKVKPPLLLIGRMKSGRAS